MEDEIRIGPRGPKRLRSERKPRRKVPRWIVGLTGVLLAIGLTAGWLVQHRIQSDAADSKAAIAAAHITDNIDTLRHLRPEIGNIRWMIAQNESTSTIPKDGFATTDEAVMSAYSGGISDANTTRCTELATWYDQVAARVPATVLARYGLQRSYDVASACFALNSKLVPFVPALNDR